MLTKLSGSTARLSGGFSSLSTPRSFLAHKLALRRNGFCLRREAGSYGQSEVVDSVLAMDSSSDGGPAASRGKEGGGLYGDKDSLRDVIDQIHSVTSRMAAKTEAADLQISDAESNTEACVSLAARLSGVLETLTDADSTLSNELAQIPPDAQNKERTDGDGRLVRWLYNIHDEASKAAYLSKAVSAGDGKGSQVGASPAAAAAASSGGGSVGNSGATAAAAAAAATRQQTGSPQDYGRPCLPGLPEGVVGHMGAFFTTRTATRLTRVNKETRQKATDSTYGVFRQFAMTRDETSSYEKIRKLRDVKHLVNIRAAHVDASDVVPCVAELLEKSAETLEELHVSPVPSDPIFGLPVARAPGDATRFPKLTQANIQSEKWLWHISNRRWALPALRSLHAPHVFSNFASLLSTSTKMERLEAEYIMCEADFTAAVANWPNLTTITGIEIQMPDKFRHDLKDLGRINDLKDALNQHWGKPESKVVPRKLCFVVSDPMIDDEYGQGEDDLRGIAEWAAEVHCELEWRPRSGLTVDCGETWGAPRAPTGLYGEIAKQLASEATEVDLLLGGIPLHRSWRDKLIFTHAKYIDICDTETSASDVVASIPEWLTEREGEGQTAASRHFPALEHIHLRLYDVVLSELPSAPSKLSRFIAGLRAVRKVTLATVRSFAVGCELLSYLPLPSLEEVSFRPPGHDHPIDSSDWPEDVPAEWSLRCPHIEHMTCPVEDDEWQGQDQAARLTDLRSLVLECFEHLKALYTMAEGCCWVQHEGNYLSMKLVAK
ncbi:unnamed protein product [Vitrella brassicaformis CCMP3155]|uniref:Uncharacterized protein n=1 Tax=Vitrella brassicaformis (strain CCMP3155) TaxID=1169540 RepID=A0A0G4FCG8_VITBC|nr:unnamed protein product [Vitrella brassicaformis CCMP3155]|eukprot:CEM10914.1 unnamed protein product [Vitrella brassicaformis CCMP3155]